jgi:hypothetical protein
MANGAKLTSWNRDVDGDRALPGALDRVLQASQRMLSDRVDLVLLDVQSVLGLVVRGLLAVGLSAALFLIAWLAAMGILLVLCAGAMPRPAALALVVAANAAAGSALLAVGLRRIEAARTVTLSRRAAADATKV